MSGHTSWADSSDVLHDLTTEKRISTAIAAKRLDLTPQTVRRMIQRGEIYPVLRHNSRRIEIYECALDDYIARKLNPTK